MPCLYANFEFKTQFRPPQYLIDLKCSAKEHFTVNTMFICLLEKEYQS